MQDYTTNNNNSGPAEIRPAGQRKQTSGPAKTDQRASVNRPAARKNRTAGLQKQTIGPAKTDQRASEIRPAGQRNQTSVQDQRNGLIHTVHSINPQNVLNSNDIIH